MSPIFRTCLAAILCSMGMPAYAASISLGNSSLPPDLSAGEVQLTITISGISEAQKTKLQADTNGLDNLEIILPDYDPSTTLKFKSEEAAEPLPLYIEQWKEMEPDQPSASSDGTTTDIFYITIKEIPTAVVKLSEKYKSNSMNLKITYLEKEGETAKVAGEETKVLVREIFAIAEAPALSSVEGTHQQLRAFWAHRADVTVKGKAEKKEPSRTNIYVIEQGTTTLQLKGKKFSETTGSTADDVSCTYTPILGPPPAKGNCVVCPDSVYLDQSAIGSQGLTGVQKPIQAPSSDEAGTVTGLDNDKAYVLFLQWEPGGLATSECIVAQPSPNFSLTELNGEGDATVVDFRCFIATAAYGTALHRDIKLFRQFRDDVLMTSWPGRLLVNAYYLLSPPLADFIADHPSLRLWVKGRLQTVADWLRSADDERR